jgi:murein L,D-transpeptidase YcbB/YkuD
VSVERRLGFIQAGSPAGLLWILILTLAACPGLVRSDVPLPDARASVPRASASEAVPILSARVLSAFYEARGHRRAWSDPEQRRGLLQTLEASGSDGFTPGDFHLDIVRRLIDRGWVALTEAERRDADLVLSDALLRYVHHQRYGKVDPVGLDRLWHDRPPPSGETLVADMQAALSGADMASSLRARFPRPFWYRHLRVGLQQALAHAAAADLPPFPDGPALAAGTRDARVALLRERLGAVGVTVPAEAADPEGFDVALADAVKRFQRAVGLTPDGIVGPATRAALNGEHDREAVERIRLNLERMRWLAADLPNEYVFVDVADFQVHVVRDERFVWSTRAIVGTTETQTPMFRDAIDHLVFNPTWSVPTSIQKKMTRVGGDFRLVDRRTGRAVSRGDPHDVRRYRLVQEPGPKNALGRVKFMFPNRHAIYLHDTAAKSLFNRPRRALSNGCVRVQNPLELAEILLGRQGWETAGIERAVASGRTRFVDLEETRPVLLYYLTAFADESGAVGFRPDLYGRDAALRAALARSLQHVQIAFPEADATDEAAAPSVAVSQTTGPEAAAPRDAGGSP